MIYYGPNWNPAEQFRGKKQETSASENVDLVGVLKILEAAKDDIDNEIVRCLASVNIDDMSSLADSVANFVVQSPASLESLIERLDQYNNVVIIFNRASEIQEQDYIAKDIAAQFSKKFNIEEKQFIDYTSRMLFIWVIMKQISLDE